jgi:DNA-binding LacI/PurR family transcriptional regulator
MEKAGYQPPAVRRGPKLGSRRGTRHGLVVMLIGEHNPAEFYKMPVFPSLLSGVEQALGRNDMSLVLAGPRPGGKLPAVLEQDNLDGVLLVGKLEPVVPPEEAKRLQRLPAAVWLLHEHGEELGLFDHVVYNNHTVGRIAAQYLADRGHKHLAFLNTRPEHPGFVLRRQVFAREAHRLGADVAELVSPLDRPRSQMEAMAELADAFAQLGPRPTGLFVPNDRQLPLLYMALAAHGITPGKNLDVISCDNDEEVLAQLNPRPATIELNWGLVGERAVEQLIWRRQHRDVRSRITTTIDPFLVTPPAAAAGE